jgi:hypothetical protein
MYRAEIARSQKMEEALPLLTFAVTILIAVIISPTYRDDNDGESDDE